MFRLNKIVVSAIRWENLRKKKDRKILLFWKTRQQASNLSSLIYLWYGGSGVSGYARWSSILGIWVDFSYDGFSWSGNSGYAWKISGQDQFEETCFENSLRIQTIADGHTCYDAFAWSGDSGYVWQIPDKIELYKKHDSRILWVHTIADGHA